MGSFEDRVRDYRIFKELGEEAFFKQTGIVTMELGFRNKITYQLVFEDYRKRGKIIKILFKVDETNWFPNGRMYWCDIAKKVMKHNNLSSIEIWYEDQDKQTGSMRECKEQTLLQEDKQ